MSQFPRPEMQEIGRGPDEPIRGQDHVAPQRERPDIWKLADAIQMDLRAAQGKLVELRSQLAALDIPDTTRARCPVETCGLTFSGPVTLAEHAYHSHGGPLPEHWQQLDERVLEETTHQ